MHFLSAASLLLAFLSSDIEEVPVYKIKPSMVVVHLRQLMPENVEFLPNDLKGVVQVRGTEEQIAEVKLMLQMFDVDTPRVLHKFKLVSPVDKVTYEVNANLRSNAGFSFSDSETGVKVKMSSRLNGDGSVMISIELDIQGAIFTQIRRLQSGSLWVIKPTDGAPMNDKAKARLAYKDTVGWPTLSVTPIVEGQKPTK